MQLDGAGAPARPVGGECGPLLVGGTGQSRDVRRQPVPERPAEEGGDGRAAQPSGQVPQRDVHGRQRVGLVAHEVAALAHQVPQHRPGGPRSECVLPQQNGSEQQVDDVRGHLGGDRRQGLAPAGGAVLGGHLDQQGLEPARVQTAPRRAHLVAGRHLAAVRQVAEVGLVMEHLEDERLDRGDLHARIHSSVEALR